MMKYLLGLLSTLLTFLFGTVILADTLTEELSIDASYRVNVLNLPLIQQPDKTFTFTLSVTSQFSGASKKATLFVDDCWTDLAVSYQGNIRMSIPLTLAPQGTHEFPLTIYRTSNDECILTFRLLDENKTLLASTQVGILPQCPAERAKKPIDEGLDYTLPEIVALQSTEPASSSPTPTSRPQKPQQKTETSLLTFTDDELTAAFDLLVEKGLLTTGDKAKLQQPLTRLTAAELFVQIALSKDIKVDSDKTCEFPDMTGFSANEINIAKLACQLNIMGVNPDYTPLDNFMPSTIIPSEQLVTAFSRLMWRDLYEAPENGAYYQLHMNTMFNLGLVDQKVIKADSNLADFVVITARALDKEQLVFAALEQIDLECATGDDTTGSCNLEEEKRSFWLW